MKTLSIDRKDKMIGAILLVGIFIFMVMFFTFVHPLYIYDADDWTYASWHRQGIPTLRQFNPTRVLPEILMPIVSEFAAKILYPITGDYIESLSWIYAIVVSLNIIAYLYMMGKLIIKEIKTSWNSIVFMLLTIWMLHFYIRPNTHMFYGANITCYFYYIIPALLNTVLVFYMIYKDEKKKSSIEMGFLFLAIYLCIFSNVLNSAVLMAYTTYVLIKSIYIFSSDWKREGKCKISRIKNLIAENTIPLFTSVLWITAEIMELQGLRANQISSERLQIGKSVKSLFEYIVGIRPIFLWITLALVISSIGISVRDKFNDRYTEDIRIYIEALVRNIVCCFLVMLYLITLCSKAGTVYLTRGDVNIDWIVFLFLIVGESFAFIYKRCNKVIMVIPYIIFLLVCEIHITQYPDNWGNYDYSAETVKALDMNIVLQVLEAESRGETFVEIHVPKYSSASNWPIPVWGGERFADCLYRHGITHNRMTITIVPDETINKQYHLQ